MLRLDLFDTAVLRVSGRLADGCREEVESFIAAQGRLAKNLVVDLTEVTYIDRTGEQVLIWLAGRGAKFTADGAYVLDICERLHLSLSELHALPERPEPMVKIVKRSSQ
jgi:hypothetical protein